MYSVLLDDDLDGMAANAHLAVKFNCFSLHHFIKMFEGHKAHKAYLFLNPFLKKDLEHLREHEKDTAFISNIQTILSIRGIFDARRSKDTSAIASIYRNSVLPHAEAVGQQLEKIINMSADELASFEKHIVDDMRTVKIQDYIITLPLTANVIVDTYDFHLAAIESPCMKDPKAYLQHMFDEIALRNVAKTNNQLPDSERQKLVERMKETVNDAIRSLDRIMVTPTQTVSKCPIDSNPLKRKREVRRRCSAHIARAR